MPQHVCPAPACHEMIDNRRAFCRRHWSRLDAATQRAIYQSLEANGGGSSDHLETLQWAAGKLTEAGHV